MSTIMEVNGTSGGYELPEVFYHDYWRSVLVENLTRGVFWHPHWRQWGPIDEVTNKVAAALMAVVFIFGTVGNCTVIIAYHRNKKLQTAANMYVVNLASTDLIMCLVNFPMLIWACLEGSWPAGNFWCQLYAFVGALSGFVSMNTLTAMAIDRYQVIYRNNAIKSRASKRSHTFIIGFIWMYSLTWASIPILGWGRYSLSGGRTSCCFDYMSRDLLNVSFILCLFMFCFTLQFALIVYCYASLLVFIFRYEKNIKSGKYTMKTENRSSRKKLKLEFKITRLIFIIIATFCLSWFPFATVALIGCFGNAALITPLSSMIPGLLAKISTAINPVLYAISHPNFRCALYPGCLPYNQRGAALSNIYNTSVCKTSEHFVFTSPS